MRSLWRLTRTQMKWSWLLLPAWMLVMLGWVFYTHRFMPLAAHQAADLYGLFEYYLPLAGAVYLAGVPAFDRDQGTAEAHLTYAQSPAIRLLLLALPGFVLWTATVGLGLVITRGWYLSGHSWELLSVLGAPSLALGGVSLAGGALARSQTGGLLAAFVWWAFDALGRGLFNKRFFLFSTSITTGLYTPAQQAHNVALVGLSGLLVALWISHRRPWWIR